VQARWRGQSAPLSRVHAGVAMPGQPVRPQRYDPAAQPLEAVVERRPVQAGGIGSLRLAVESGLHLLRLLDAQQMSRSYRADFIARFALQPVPEAGRAALDGQTLDYADLMAGRVPDGRLLAAALRGADGKRAPLPADLAVVAGDKAEVHAAIDAWLVYLDGLFSEPSDGADAWQRERMEYAFSAGAGLGDADITLTAAEYRGGHLDWHSLDVDPAIKLGATLDNAASEQVRTVMPAPVSFRGAPAQRYWEFEDARIDYGLLPAGPGDLPHMLLSDFATNFGNDWYVIPVDLAVGTLTRTRSLVVKDSFGVQTLIRPHNADAPSAFSMYSLATLARPPAPGSAAATQFNPPAPVPNLFFLAPSLLRSVDGTPRDEVLLLRDEMANMAWAVERVVQGPVEQRLERAAEAAATPPAVLPGTPAPAGMPSYRLASEVPAHWVPLLPQKQPAPDAGLRLVRAALLAADGTDDIRSAHGAILAGPGLRLFDEEVPREGARITRSYQWARWIGGGSVLWLGQRKSVGRGEGASGLQYDSADPPAP
jgi:hypothetical protein